MICQIFLSYLVLTMKAGILHHRWTSQTLRLHLCGPEWWRNRKRQPL